jgi:hypothetical protein
MATIWWLPTGSGVWTDSSTLLTLTVDWEFLTVLYGQVGKQVMAVRSTIIRRTKEHHVDIRAPQVLAA